MDVAHPVKTLGRGIAPDATSSGKEHFEVLDGLRGSAALLVVVFHLLGVAARFGAISNPLPHAYLAVDFFFGLSGFVIGYAYDDRWEKMTVGQFFKMRLVRLHPMLVLGMLLGVASYVFDPYGAPMQSASKGLLLLSFALGLFVLPSPKLPNRWTSTHALNAPAWTLMQEYLGNVVYAVLLRRISTRALGGIAAGCGLTLAVCSNSRGWLDGGWGWENAWMAPIRLAFPFVTGLWLYRVRERLPRPKLGFLLLSAVLALAFAMPFFPAVGRISLNGVYDAACVILLFPLITLAGAHSQAGSGVVALCKACGRISYPLYITHMAFLYVYLNFGAKVKPSPALMLGAGALLLLLVLLVAWVSVKYWDEPVRARLRRGLGL